MKRSRRTPRASWFYITLIFLVVYTIGLTRNWNDKPHPYPRVEKRGVRDAFVDFTIDLWDCIEKLLVLN